MQLRRLGDFDFGYIGRSDCSFSFRLQLRDALLDHLDLTLQQLLQFSFDFVGNAVVHSQVAGLLHHGLELALQHDELAGRAGTCHIDSRAC